MAPYLVNHVTPGPDTPKAGSLSFGEKLQKYEDEEYNRMFSRMFNRKGQKRSVDNSKNSKSKSSCAVRCPAMPCHVPRSPRFAESQDEYRERKQRSRSKVPGLASHDLIGSSYMA